MKREERERERRKQEGWREREKRREQLLVFVLVSARVLVSVSRSSNLLPERTIGPSSSLGLCTMEGRQGMKRGEERERVKCNLSLQLPVSLFLPSLSNSSISIIAYHFLPPFLSICSLLSLTHFHSLRVLSRKQRDKVLSSQEL